MIATETEIGPHHPAYPGQELMLGRVDVQSPERIKLFGLRPSLGIRHEKSGDRLKLDGSVVENVEPYPALIWPRNRAEDISG